MDIEYLESFIMVVREKSISKAAQSLHVSQPTLTSRIHRLEEELNLKLIERSWRGIKLTMEGKYFLPYATESLQNMTNAHTVLLSKDLKRPFREVINNSNELYIGIESWLVPCFTKYILQELKDIPNLKYKIVTYPTPTIKELLNLGVLDIGIFYGDNEQLKQLSTPTIEDEMILLYSSQVREVNSEIPNIELLKEKSFLLFDNPILVHHSKFTEQILREFQIERLQVTDNVNVMMQFIEFDLGYTIVPKSSVYHYILLMDRGLLNVGYQYLGSKLERSSIQIAYNSHKSIHFSNEEFAHNLHRSFNENINLIN